MKNDISQNTNKFAHLNAIAAGEVKAPALSNDIIFWEHQVDNPLVGEILGFDGFDHPQYGRQETVIVQRENDEVVSAILTNYLQNGMQMQNGEVGDLVLIEKQGQERSKYGKMFNRFLIVVEKQ